MVYVQQILETGDSCHSRYQSFIIGSLLSLDSSTSRTATCQSKKCLLPAAYGGALSSIEIVPRFMRSIPRLTIWPCNLHFIPVSSGESSWDACHGKLLVGTKIAIHLISSHLTSSCLTLPLTPLSAWCQYIEQFNDGKSFHSYRKSIGP